MLKETIWIIYQVFFRDKSYFRLKKNTQKKPVIWTIRSIQQVFTEGLQDAREKAGVCKCPDVWGKLGSCCPQRTSWIVEQWYINRRMMLLTERVTEHRPQSWERKRKLSQPSVQREVLEASFVFSGFPGGSDGKESTCHVGDLGSILGSGRSPRGGYCNPLQYSCLIPWPEEPGGLQSMGPQRVGYDWVTKHKEKRCRKSNVLCKDLILMQPAWTGDMFHTW